MALGYTSPSQCQAGKGGFQFSLSPSDRERLYYEQVELHIKLVLRVWPTGTPGGSRDPSQRATRSQLFLPLPPPFFLVRACVQWGFQMLLL